MDRRLVGVLVLLLAGVLVTVVPAMTGRRVAGSAVAMSFPGPPQPGDCVVARPPRSNTYDNARQIVTTELAFGPCTGTVMGEVSSAVDDDPSAPGAQDAVGRCFNDPTSFAGDPLTEGPGEQPIVPGGPLQWSAGAAADAELIVPGPVERSAGRHWSACLLSPYAFDPGPAPGYRGLLQDAFRTGRLPDAYGSCWASDDLDSAPQILPCDQPHPAELLASGWIQDRSLISRPDIDAGCVKVAQRIMRTDDPTRGGALTVVLDPVRLDGSSKPDDPLSVGCFITASGSARLSGSVIGIAGGPLPLTG